MGERIKKSMEGKRWWLEEKGRRNWKGKREREYINGRESESTGGTIKERGLTLQEKG